MKEKNKNDRPLCKDCVHAKDIQKHRPSLFCSKHRAVINDNTTPGCIAKCGGMHFERKQK